MDRQTDPMPIGITVGDPAGIGPEVILKALASTKVDRALRYVVIGGRRVVERALAELALPMQIVTVDRPSDAGFAGEVVHVFEGSNANVVAPPIGSVTAESGEASVGALRDSVELIQSGQLSGLVTAPINKQSVRQAGYSFIDQAEFFSTSMHVDPEAVTTMVASGELRAFLVTKHIPLALVSRRLTSERVVRVGEIADRTLRALGSGRQPRLVVTSLNPHAGEGGLLGGEEAEIIGPAIETLRRAGIDAAGPVAGKTAFRMMLDGHVHGVIAMYHDQTAPIELLAGRAYTVTLGLPVVRTSVGHGTAHDIAGKGVADPGSMLEAIAVTTQLVRSIRE